MNETATITAKRKYPKYNTIILEIKNQEEYDTIRTALLTLASIYPVENMVRICDTKTTPEEMVSLASDIRAIIEKA